MNKRIIVVPILLFSMIISSCSNKRNTSENESSLTPEEISYFTKLKEDYYQQRFLDAGTNIYDARKGFGEDTSEPSPYSIDYATIDSVDDLKVHYSYCINDEFAIISFLYCGQGNLNGSWFQPSYSVVEFKDNSKEIKIMFNGNIYAPEVYYHGTFLYLHEAFSIGIYNLDNPNIIITNDEFVEIDGELVEMIEGYMPEQLINF
jgi:hypothetical protein